jgi:hypothetical protein
MKSWPTVKCRRTDIIDDSMITEFGPGPLIPGNTTCKHGVGECETCGTTATRDAIHTTVGGRGVVARIKRGK